MNAISASAVFWIWGLVQVLGLVSALAARVSEGSSGQSASHGVFLAALALVGITTVIAVAMGPDWWLISAAILAIMVLTVTCDFSRNRQTVLD